MSVATAPATLKRSLSLPLITLYGLGTIVGAGIYVLIGEVTGQAGLHAPLAFLGAAIVAGFTAFTYAELTARFPLSAAEAVYMQAAFQRPWLSALAGWAVVAVGVISTATLANGFVGYLNLFIVLPHTVIIVAFVVGLGALAAWGISQSAWVAAAITLVEVGGLVWVVYVAGDNLGRLPELGAEWLLPADGAAWSGVALGAFVAFYAFIGFEDMVNVAEEVKNPRRNLPLAIIIALVMSSVLYVLIALVAVTALPPAELAASAAPLATIVEQSSSVSPLTIAVISLIAVINGALIQTIMAARMLYGMAQNKLAPAGLADVSPATQTPVKATLLAVALVLVFALWLPLVTLAKLTSFVTLLIFAGVNLALIRLKLSQPAPTGISTYPIWVPVIGFALCLLLIGLQGLWGWGD